MQPAGKKITTKKKQSDYQAWKQNIGDQWSRLNFISVVDIFRFAKKLDHGIAQQSLFNIFNQSDDGQEKRPNAHFTSCREYFPDQDDITDQTKSDQETTVQQSKKNRLNPKGGFLFNFQLDYLALNDIIYGLTPDS